MAAKIGTVLLSLVVAMIGLGPLYATYKALAQGDYGPLTFVTGVFGLGLVVIALHVLWDEFKPKWFRFKEVFGFMPGSIPKATAQARVNYELAERAGEFAAWCEAQTSLREQIQSLKAPAVISAAGLKGLEERREEIRRKIRLMDQRGVQPAKREFRTAQRLAEHFKYEVESSFSGYLDPNSPAKRPMFEVASQSKQLAAATTKAYL